MLLKLYEIKMACPPPHLELKLPPHIHIFPAKVAEYNLLSGIYNGASFSEAAEAIDEHDIFEAEKKPAGWKN